MEQFAIFWKLLVLTATAITIICYAFTKNQDYFHWTVLLALSYLILNTNV